MDRRIRRLAAAYQRREPPATAPRFDFSGLTHREQAEADRLLAVLEAHQRRSGGTGVEMLTARERARLGALLERVSLVGEAR